MVENAVEDESKAVLPTRLDEAVEVGFGAEAWIKSESVDGVVSVTRGMMHRGQQDATAS